MTTAVGFLYWCDVDPRRHEFDASAARSIAERHVLWGVDGDRVRQAPVKGRKRDDIESRIDRELIGAYGAWVAGWRWAASEPGGGGPVSQWCCAGDSVFRKGDKSATDTVDRVVAAVTEWRAFLTDLAQRFDALRAATNSSHDPDAVEHVAAQLLPLVLERTDASDAWYRTFAQVLSWYLESAGLGAASVRDAVHAVISGRFGSWIAPDEALASTVATELGSAVQRATRPPFESVDALTRWLAIRTEVFAQPPLSTRPAPPVCGDGHRRFIEGPERTRDPDRAARMARALDLCRRAASQDEPLTFDGLATWQSAVLGEPAGFRTTDAYAKDGRERYAVSEDTRSRFDAVLAEANDPAVACVTRAARVYLDVCFFHPFADGNARAARLALDHVLTRGGLSLHSAEPLFVVARSSHDRWGASSFAYVVDYLAGPSQGV